MWDGQPVAAKLADLTHQVHRVPRPTAAAVDLVVDEPLPIRCTQELARLARGRPRTGIDVATFWLAFAAIASGAVSLVIVFVELLGR